MLSGYESEEAFIFHITKKLWRIYIWNSKFTVTEKYWYEIRVFIYDARISRDFTV